MPMHIPVEYSSLRMYAKFMISITDGDRRTDHFWGTLWYMSLQRFIQLVFGFFQYTEYTYSYSSWVEKKRAS